MLLYIYNQHYMNEYIATEDVAINDVNEISAPYTAVEPPAHVAEKCWCYDADAGSWNKQVDDFRGATIYATANSTITNTIKFVGDVPDGYTMIEPPDNDKTYSFNGSEWIAIVEPKIFTKLAIRRACRTLCLEEKLDALLSSNEMFKKDWDDAQEIDLADEITSQALRTNAFTDVEYDSIIGELQK